MTLGDDEAEARETGTETAGSAYAQRLARLEGTRWRQILNVQAPYRWNIRRLRLGRVLDVGCGLGRNLAHLDPGSVGVDHNPESIAIARERGLTAFTSDEFPDSGYAVRGSFDSLLFAHVIEHLSQEYAITLVQEYLTYLTADGRVCFITPQERGHRSDATHVSFTDFAALERLCSAVGLAPERRFSFPLPRVAGTVFTYNEFVLVARPRR